MVIVISMLEKIIHMVRNSDAYMQFDTCRKLNSVSADVYIDMRQASDLRYSTKSLKGVYHLYEGTKQNMLFRKDGKGNSCSHARCKFKE